MTRHNMTLARGPLTASLTDAVLLGRFSDLRTVGSSDSRTSVGGWGNRALDK
jgi:hypothetical protein